MLSQDLGLMLSSTNIWNYSPLFGLLGYQAHIVVQAYVYTCTYKTNKSKSRGESGSRFRAGFMTANCSTWLYSPCSRVTLQHRWLRGKSLSGRLSLCPVWLVTSSFLCPNASDYLQLLRSLQIYIESALLPYLGQLPIPTSPQSRQ